MSGFGHRTGVPISKEPGIVNERMNLLRNACFIQANLTDLK